MGVFSMFSQKQVAEFKEGFQLMDRDKDGILSKNDLRATFDELGRIAPEKELDEMINDAPGPTNFTMLLTMFAERQSGGSDEDDVVINAFKSSDDGEGHIDGESLRHALMTWGDKFTSSRRCLRIDGHRLREQNRHPETDRDVDGRSRRGRSRSCLSNLKTKATSFHCTFNVSSPRCYLPKNIFFLFFFFFVSLFIVYGTFVVVSGG